MVKIAHYAAAFWKMAKTLSGPRNKRHKKKEVNSI